MDTIKFDKKNTLVVAHRGLCGLELENTNPAFVAAGNRSYYAIETDVHRTADGRFVVVHDGDLVRIAGEDVVVKDTTLEELQKIVLMDKDGTKDRTDLRVPLLENYVSICKKYEKHCVLELKAIFTDEEIAGIIDIFRQHDYLDEVTFISFDYDNLLKVRKILPNQPAQYLIGPVTQEEIDRMVAGKFDADVYLDSLTEENIAQMHNLGIRVNCYTVNEKEKAEKLAAWGVDFITTNILE